MDDSNGRYTSGFLWGNNYWTGSQTQCLQLIPESQVSSHTTEAYKPSLISIAAKLVREREDVIPNASIENTETGANRVRRDNRHTVSPGLTMGYQHGKLKHDSFPTFTPSFFTLRIHLNSSKELTPKVSLRP